MLRRNFCAKAKQKHNKKTITINRPKMTFILVDSEWLKPVYGLKRITAPRKQFNRIT